MKLSQLLPAAQIRVPLLAASKPDAIAELLTLLPLRDDAQRAEVRVAVLARESELSTGIGRGVAIPHGKTEAVGRHTCAFGISAAPMDFGAIDGKPCTIFFMCVSNPKDANEHVRVLLQVARILNNPAARAALEAARTPEAVRQVFLDDEAQQVPPR
ncbi:MAG: PTS system fructose-specific EIIABC component [Planctomycetes bacterium]|nr:PTS system fructose-specific EIIABC component [Planctomycetota bacterium]